MARKPKLRKCRVCKEDKTSEHFSSSSHRQCIECLDSLETSSTHKRCYLCKAIRTIDCFSASDGKVSTTCQECRDRTKEWKSDHPEVREKSAEKDKKRAHDWYHVNKEKVSEEAKARRLEIKKQKTLDLPPKSSTTKECEECNETLSVDDFYKNGKSYGRMCKPCTIKDGELRISNPEAHKEILAKRLDRRAEKKAQALTPTEKECNECLTLKPLSDFYKGNGLYGYRADCKKCCESNRPKETNFHTCKRCGHEKLLVCFSLTNGHYSPNWCVTCQEEMETVSPGEPSKQCDTCLRELSLTLYYVHPKSGIGATCSKCVSDLNYLRRKDQESYQAIILERQKAKEDEKRRAESIITSKICTRCNEEKDLETEFREHRGLYGRSSWCLQCEQLYIKEWAKRPGVKLKRVISHRKSYTKHAVKYRDKAKQRYVFYSESSFTVKDWEEVLHVFNNCCAYCLRNDQPLTMDHMIPVSRGGLHEKENIVPACKPCNSSKGDRSILLMASKINKD